MENTTEKTMEEVKTRQEELLTKLAITKEKAYSLNGISMEKLKEHQEASERLSKVIKRISAELKAINTLVLFCSN